MQFAVWPGYDRSWDEALSLAQWAEAQLSAVPAANSVIDEYGTRRNTNAAYIGVERRTGGKADIVQQPSLLDKARSTV